MYGLTISNDFMLILAWALGAGAVVTTLVWGAVWLGVERSMRAVPTLRLGQGLARNEPPSGRVCVIVPAHNESRVIGRLIRSLRSETYAQLRVVLVLDRCTDDTASIARAGIAGDERFEIIEVDTCPDDWAGKVHAVHAGVRFSRGAVDSEYLLFADADTVFSPECIASSLALMRQRKLEMLSLLSTLIYETGFTRVVQTAAAFELMRRFPLKRANAARNRRAFANGQFMMFKRSAYEAVGGHETVKSALLEDLAFARLVRDKGFNAGVFLADGLLHCDMYANWPQFRRGWKRIYTEAAERNAARLSSWAAQIRWFGSVFPLMALGSGLLGAMSIAHDAAIGTTLLALFLIAAIVWLGALTRISLLSHAPVWTGPLHIIGAWVTANLLGEAAADLRLHRPTSWGDREYFLGADTLVARRPADEVEIASRSTATR